MRKPLALAALAAAIGCASPPRRPAVEATNSSAETPLPSSPASATSDSAPAPPPSPARYGAPTPFAGGDGTSADDAVVVLAETEDEGIDLEHHWIFDHHGRFRKIRGGLASADGKHFDVITVELADHSEKTIYFDITGFYGIMEKPASPPPK